MSEALVLVESTDALRPARAASAELLALPRLIVDAGPVAVARFLEFFAARIANRRTRAARWPRSATARACPRLRRPPSSCWSSSAPAGEMPSTRGTGRAVCAPISPW